MKGIKNVIRYLLLSILILSVLLVVPNLKRDIPVEELIAKYTNDQSQFIDIDGLKVHYRDEGSGMPLVLIHGTAASLHTWDDWTEQLKPQYRVIRMDLPGFGLTGPDPGADYTIPYYHQFLLKFLEALKIENLILGGNSLGGEISWYFAGTEGDRVKSLVLVDPAGSPTDQSVPLVLKMARMPILSSILRHATPRAFIRKNMKEVYHDDTKVTDELVERYYLMALREGNRDAFIARAQSIGDQDHSPMLASITAKTLLLWGQEDLWTPVAYSGPFVDQIPDARLHILPNAGHVPMEEIPMRSVAVVKAFLNEADGWTSLWNGKDLEGWEKYLNTPYQRREDEAGNPLEPYGIDNDPDSVMSVVQLDDGSAIRISGVTWGTLHTSNSYGNYRLKLRAKWGDAMHPPREKGPRDSGLLYHCFGEPGGFNPWMASQELQVQQGDIGDYWPTGPVEIDIPSIPLNDQYYRYEEGAPLRTYVFADIDRDNPDEGLSKRRVIKSPDAEKPHGQWNDIELITYGDSSIHIVNGEVVMRLYNSRVASTQEPLIEGRIALQSEGAEVFYKDIYLRPISEIPEAFRQSL